MRRRGDKTGSRELGQVVSVLNCKRRKESSLQLKEGEKEGLEGHGSLPPKGYPPALLEDWKCVCTWGFLP